jgi:hypothetical protein
MARARMAPLLPPTVEGVPAPSTRWAAGTVPPKRHHAEVEPFDHDTVIGAALTIRRYVPLDAVEDRFEIAAMLGLCERRDTLTIWKLLRRMMLRRSVR